MTVTGLGIRPYKKGLEDLGGGLWAWMQPDGGWGWSNAGLIAGDQSAILVDTLFDRPLTEDMLSAMRRNVPQAKQIDRVVNSHSNGDHCNGNCCLPDAKVIASAATAEGMKHENPATMRAFTEQSKSGALGDLGDFFLRCFGDFDFDSCELRLPDETFTGKLALPLDDKSVELIEVGPAHTEGDTLVWVESQATVFTGDILFIEGHPIMWAGPVGNWIAACERILALQPKVVVPGHGPLTDSRGVIAVRDYLVYIRDEARKRFDAGMPVLEAARDINLSDYSSWGDAERIAVNVHSLYREFSGDSEGANVAEVFGVMAVLAKDARH